MSEYLPPPGEFQTTAEIRDARFAAELKLKRRKLLAWSAPVMVIAFLVALKLLSAVAMNAAGTAAYDSANYNTSAARYSNLQYFNYVEPYKASYNEGTAIYATGQFYEATLHLDVALSQVPKSADGEPPAAQECDVRTNYSLALEGLADEAMAQDNATRAKELYEDALEMLAGCGSDGGNGGEQAQEAQERQEQSQGEAQEREEQQQQEQEQDNNGGQGGEDDGDPSQSPSNGEDPSQSPSEGEDPSQSPSNGESQSPSPSEGESEQSSSPSPSSGEGGEGESTSPSSDGGGQSPSPTRSVDPKEEELNSRNQSAQESREADEQASGGGSGQGQNW